MAMQIIDSFGSSMKKYLDDRQGWASLAALQANTSTQMPNGFMAYCIAEDKWYKLTATDEADPLTYAWTEFGGGGGGGQEQFQFAVMPTAEATLIGELYQYIGATDANYTYGYWYQVIDDPDNPGTYIWKNVQVQNDEGIIQYTVMPDPDTAEVGKIVQYTGATGTYKRGYFYTNEPVEFSIDFGAVTPFATVVDQYALENCGLTDATSTVVYDEASTSWKIGATVVDLETWGIKLNDSYTPADADTFDIIKGTAVNTWINIKVQEGGSGGGGSSDAKISSAITATTTVGGIETGTTYTAGTLQEAILRSLLCPPISPSFSVALTPTGGLKENGTVVNTPVISVSVTNLGTADTNSVSIALEKGGVAVGTAQAVTATGTYTFNDTDNISADTTYTATLSWTQDGVAKTKVSTATYTFVDASFIGNVSVAPAAVTADIVLALTKVIKSSAAYTYSNITMTNQRVCYAFPTSMGAISSIKDGNNFDVTGSFTTTSVTINTVAYTVLTSTDTATLTNGKIIFS